MEQMVELSGVAGHAEEEGHEGEELRVGGWNMAATPLWNEEEGWRDGWRGGW